MNLGMIGIQMNKLIPKATSKTIHDTVRILRRSRCFSLIVLYGGKIASTNSQCCINWGHFLASMMKASTPYAVVAKKVKGTIVQRKQIFQ